MDNHYITLHAPLKPKTWRQRFSWITEKATGGGCHMGVLKSQDTVIHADITVREESIASLLKRGNYSGYTLWKCTHQRYNHDLAIAYASGKIGMPYDVTKIFTVAQGIIYGWLGKTLNKQYDNKKMVMCQELAQESAITARLPPDRDWRYPLDFENNDYMEKTKEVKIA